MDNYAQPYRGLPAEIRLTIWSFLIPPRATVWGDGSSDISSRSNDHNRLELSASLQIQLLRLNREINGEVLPILKKVEIRLYRGIIHDALWPKLAVALQSPVLGALHYPWHDSTLQGLHHERFLPKLLVHGSSGCLNCLHIRIAQFNADKRVDVFGVTDRSDLILDWKLLGHEALASFSGALLQKGTVVKDIIIEIEEIQERNLWEWCPDLLHYYMQAQPCKPIHPGHRVRQHFHRFIRDHAGLIKQTDIQITTEFCEKEGKNGKYCGTVKFTRIPQ